MVEARRRKLTVTAALVALAGLAFARQQPSIATPDLTVMAKVHQANQMPILEQHRDIARELNQEQLTRR